MADKKDIFMRVADLPSPPSRKSKDYLKSYKDWTYAAVSKIAMDSSTVPIDLYKKTVTGSGDSAQVEITQVYEHESLIVLQNVNEIMTWQQLREITTIYTLLLGEAAWALIRNGSGQILEIYPLRPDWIEMKPDGKGGIASYKYKPQGFQHKGVDIDPANIVFFKDFDPLNPYRGYGKVQAAAMNIDIDDFQNEWNRNWFFNSAQPSMLISVDADMSTDQKKRFMEAWRQNFGGRRNANKVGIISGSKASVDKISPTMQEMDFLESKAWLRDAILAVFNMSKSDVGIYEDVNRAASATAERRYIKGVVKPRLINFVGVLNELFLPNYNQPELFFNFEDPVPEDVNQKMAMYENGIKNFWLTPNEIREQEQLPPVEGGDSIYMPFSVQPIGGVTEGIMENVRGLFGRTKDKKKGIIKLKAKKRSKCKQYKFGAPVPVIKTKDYFENREKEKMGRNLLKLITYIMESRDKKTNKMFTDDEKEFYWKAIVAQTDIQEEKLMNILRQLSRDQQEEILNTIREGKDYKAFNKKEQFKQWAKQIQPFLTQIGAAKLEEMLQNFGLQNYNVNELQNLSEEYINDKGMIWVEQHLTNINGSVDTIKQETTDVNELESMINELYATESPQKESHAKLMARIGIFGVVNWALDTSYKESGVVAGKEWLAAMDERTRPSHAAANGQIVKLDEKFTLGSGNKAKRPLDPSLPAEDLIGCRCVTVPVIGKNLEIDTYKGKVQVGDIYKKVINTIEASEKEQELKKKEEKLKEQQTKLNDQTEKINTDMEELERIAGLNQEKAQEQIKTDAHNQAAREIKEMERLAKINIVNKEKQAERKVKVIKEKINKQIEDASAKADSIIQNAKRKAKEITKDAKNRLKPLRDKIKDIISTNETK